MTSNLNADFRPCDPPGTRILVYGPPEPGMPRTIMGTIVPFDPHANGPRESAVAFRRAEPLRSGPSFHEALALDASGDPRAAERYREAIEAGEAPAHAWCNLGVIESRHGRKRSAQACFIRSLKDDPRQPATHFNLANLYYDQGEYRMAKVHYRLTVDLEPDNRDALWSLAEVQLLCREYGAAYEALRRYRDASGPEGRHRVDALLRRLNGELAMDGT